MKVLFVVHGFPPVELGGAEIYSFSLAKALLDMGLEVVVFARTVNLKKKDYSITEDNVKGLKVYRIINNYNDIFTFFDFFINRTISRKFKQIIENEQPDIIHFQHLFGLSGDLPYIAKLHNVPSVLTLHDYWYICPRVNCFTAENGICAGPSYGYNCCFCYNVSSGEPSAVHDVGLLSKVISNPKLKAFAKRILPEPVKDILKRYFLSASAYNANVNDNDHGDASIISSQRLFEYFFRYVFLKNQLSMCHKILSPSMYIKKKYEANGYNNICYIPLGIELLPKKQKPERRNNGKPVIFGYVGNISPTKGFSVLIQELKRIESSEGFLLSVYGQIYDKEYFRQVMNGVSDKLKNKIKFHGRFDREVESLRNVYHNMDVLIFPSICEENAPLVVREALSCGIPVIGSNLGGVCEVVLDGENGLLFDPYKPGDLARKLESLLKEDNLLERLAEGARSTKVVDISNHAQEILKVYKGALRI